MTLSLSIPDFQSYQKLVNQASENYLEYWKFLAVEHLNWHSPFNKVLDDSNIPFYKWFPDGSLNASYQCLDYQIAQGLGDKTALIFESDEGKVTTVTYSELLSRVKAFTRGLRSLKVSQGDRVVIYMPMSVEAIVAMQACARIGAIHSVVFGGFSAKSLKERIEDAGAQIVITANYQRRGGKLMGLKSIVDEALEDLNIQNVVVYQRAPDPTPMTEGRDLWFQNLMEIKQGSSDPHWSKGSDPLFILYTSGSTGKPKGILHGTAGYLLHSILTMKWTFDIQPQDVFWCTADIGWITGHTYVAYGPLATGATQVIFEGVPTYPNPGRFWEMIQRHKVSIFYTAPTAIRALLQASSTNPSIAPNAYDLSTLRILGTVGEPISPEAWKWYHTHVGGGRCPVLDTFWQTETGGHLITPLPHAHELVPGSCALPFPGITAEVVDESGAPVPYGTQGYLVVQKPWPSMLQGIWGDDARFVATYFPEKWQGKLYLAGDGALRDPKSGYFTIMGRVDDVLNVSGHRLGTAEIEAALATHPHVGEAAVVGKKDSITGESVFAYVVLKDCAPSPTLEKEIQVWVGREISPIAKPARIVFVEGLPKTRSGKIMRRLLRAIANGEEIQQDITTLDAPQIVETLVKTVGNCVI